MPTASPIAALTGCDRFTENVSFGSNVVSPLMATLIVRDVANGSKVTVPLAAT